MIYSLYELIESSSSSGISSDFEVEPSYHTHLEDLDSSIKEISPLEDSKLLQLLPLAIEISWILKLYFPSTA